MAVGSSPDLDRVDAGMPREILEVTTRVPCAAATASAYMALRLGESLLSRLRRQV